jgi:phosphohistidine phosphatase
MSFPFFIFRFQLSLFMKTIILVRHAKSSWEDFSLPDFDRPLNDRGRRDAPVMAERLRERGIVPELLVSSTAKRAQKTCKLFAEALGMDKSAILLKEELYLAEPDMFGKVIVSLNDRISCVALYAHNPGITAFANLTGVADIDDMPTCSIFAYTAEAREWKDVAKASKKFLFFDQPKHPAP